MRTRRFPVARCFPVPAARSALPPAPGVQQVINNALDTPDNRVSAHSCIIACIITGPAGCQRQMQHQGVRELGQGGIPPAVALPAVMLAVRLLLQPVLQDGQRHAAGLQQQQPRHDPLPPWERQAACHHPRLPLLAVERLATVGPACRLGSSPFACCHLPDTLPAIQRMRVSLGRSASSTMRADAGSSTPPAARQPSATSPCPAPGPR